MTSKPMWALLLLFICNSGTQAQPDNATYFPYAQQITDDNWDGGFLLASANDIGKNDKTVANNRSSIPEMLVPNQMDTLVITEIMYNPPESGQDSSEFIEIYNPMNKSLNLAGFYFSRGVSYTFGNTLIPSKGYVVICGDSLSIFNNYGFSAHEWSSGVLSNVGEDIVLKDPNGRTIDSVDYDDSSPWPVGAQGVGPSIVLCDVSSDNNLGMNWTESISFTGKTINGMQLRGSPGKLDVACGGCSVTDSSFAATYSCDSSLAGSISTLFSGIGGCDSVHTTVTIYQPSDSVILPSAAICAGDSLLIFGEWRKTAGVYHDSLHTSYGCDSIISATLLINNLDTTYKNSTTLDLAMSGVYDTTYTNINGCDSTIIHTVTYVSGGVDTLVISEIMYNPPESGTDSLEYIEIYNPNSQPMSLAGYSVSNAVTYGFGNISIPPKGHVVVCKDSVALHGQYGVSAFEWSGTLSNSGEAIVLRDSAGNILDSVFYSKTGSWPSGADGNGPSIVLCDWTLDNSQGSNWIESGTSTGIVINGSVLKGSPGALDLSCGGCLTPDSTFISMLTCDTSQAGVSTLNLINGQGCDSVVTTVVSFDPGNLKTIGDIKICEGDSTPVFGEYQNLAGSYFDTLSNANGCDSVIVVNLIVVPSVVHSVKDSICPGSGLFVGGSYQTIAGIYHDTLSTSVGCDSVVITELSIRTDPGCGVGHTKDSLVIVTIPGWTQSTEVNINEAGGYPWLGVSNLPALGTFSLSPQIGQPKPHHSIDSVEGAMVFKAGNGVTFFRTTFDLDVDTGVSVEFTSFMDDGIEIYINGFMIAREADRDVSNLSGAPHHLVIKQNGDRENGAGGDQEFDVVNNYRMDSVVHTGTNELILALRNAPQSADKGGVSFRMDIKTGEPYMPVLTGYLVSDAEWQKSTQSEAGGSSWSWGGISGLPAANSYTEEVELGQPYGWYSTEEVEASYAIKAGENVSFYRRRFSLVDSAHINVRLRSTFDENLLVYINDSLVAGNYQHGIANRALPSHDALFPAGGPVVNGNAGGDMFMQLEDVDFNQILRKGNNYVTVALQNRANDKGGFSLRLDMDKAGSPVIRKSTKGGKDAGKSKVAKLDVDFDVYPNPTDGVVNINLIESPSRDNEVMITDVNGKLLLRRSLVNPETGIMDLDISELPKGMYIVKVRSGEIFKGKPLLRF